MPASPMIPTNTEIEILLDGVVLTVRAKFNGRGERDSLIWTVKMTCEGRSASFKYKIGRNHPDGGDNLNFDHFAAWVSVESMLGDPHHINGYEWGTRDWAQCRDTCYKLDQVLAWRFSAFERCATRNRWEVVPVTESVEQNQDSI